MPHPFDTRPDRGNPFAASETTRGEAQTSTQTCTRLAATDTRVTSSFIPVSYEALDDIPNLASEIGKLTGDAKDTVESKLFWADLGGGVPAQLSGRRIAARGLMLHWRVGADCIDPDAFNVLYS